MECGLLNVSVFSFLAGNLSKPRIELAKTETPRSKTLAQLSKDRQRRDPAMLRGSAPPQKALKELIFVGVWKEMLSCLYTLAYTNITKEHEFLSEEEHI